MLFWQQDGDMSMSAEICVVRDLLQNCQQLFDVDDDELERERRQLAEQSKLTNMVSIDEVVTELMLFTWLAWKSRELIKRQAKLTFNPLTPTVAIWVQL